MNKNYISRDYARLKKYLDKNGIYHISLGTDTSRTLKTKTLKSVKKMFKRNNTMNKLLTYRTAEGLGVK